MIYCFLIDCNPSMCSLSDSMSQLDLAKCAIEQFLLKLKINNQLSLERSLLLFKSGDFDFIVDFQ